MAEVQNIGPMDYPAVGVNDYNNVNAQDYTTAPAEDLSNMPVVYDEATEQKKKAAIGMTGATILGLSMLAIGGFIGHKMGSKGVQAAEKAAEEAKIKAEEALKKYEQTQEAAAQIEEVIAENNEKGVFGRFFGFQKMKDKISEIIAPFKKEGAKAEETTAKEAEGAAEKAAEDIAKEAENAAAQ